MSDDAPTFAVTFKDDNPQANRRIGVYEQALEFTDLVDRVLDKVEGARFHLKDSLDKSSTIVALRIAQAGGELSKQERRNQYRVAQRAATDCAAILDILARRRGVDLEVVGPARGLVLALVSQLAHLAAR